jgi:hypothetical protein
MRGVDGSWVIGTSIIDVPPLDALRLTDPLDKEGSYKHRPGDAYGLWHTEGTT